MRHVIRFFRNFVLATVILLAASLFIAGLAWGVSVVARGHYAVGAIITIEVLAVFGALLFTLLEDF